MKNNISFFAIIILVTIAIVSCKTSFNVQIYRFEPSIDSAIYDQNGIRNKITESDVKSITLKNDSILEYSKRYGRLFSRIAIHYRVVNDELIIDSKSLNGYDVLDITNMHFIYSQDSLINKETNEKYYNQKYIDKIKMR